MKPSAGRLGAMFLLTVVLLMTVCVLVLYAAAEAKKPKGPRSPGGAVPLPRAPLLKENSRLIDVEGLILDMKTDLKIGPVHRAVFQPKDGLGYLILLENELLEKTLSMGATLRTVKSADACVTPPWASSTRTITVKLLGPSSMPRVRFIASSIWLAPLTWQAVPRQQSMVCRPRGEV